jgi:hypothetical protein
VTNITKHNTKQEGESDTSKDSRVHFFVGRNTIGVDNFLEGPCESIISEQARRFHMMVNNHCEGWNFNIYVLFLDFSHLIIDFRLVRSWNPTVSMEELIILLKLIKTCIESFLLVQE